MTAAVGDDVLLSALRNCSWSVGGPMFVGPDSVPQLTAEMIALYFDIDNAQLARAGQ